MMGKGERDMWLGWHGRPQLSSILCNMRQYGDLTLTSQTLTENVLPLRSEVIDREYVPRDLS
jgi:hypothetical protein